ncbi:MAG: thioredoxin family protein [Aureliella sp.]
MILKIVQVVMLAVVAVSGFSQVVNAQDIPWTHSPEQAVEMAHQSGKMILVTVGAEWCHYCKKMDRETWPNPSISQLVTEN